MLHRRQEFVILPLVCLLAGGCGCGDVAAKPTVQTIRLQLIDTATEKPIRNAQLLLTLNYDVDHPQSESELTPKEWQHYKKVWDQARWVQGTTDQDGNAKIVIDCTPHDQSRGSKPPAEREGLTGKPFIVRIIRGSESPEERVKLILESGESKKAKTVTVTVLEIGKPEYVETK